MHPKALQAYFALRKSTPCCKRGMCTPAEAWRYAMSRHEGIEWCRLCRKLVPIRTDC